MVPWKIFETLIEVGWTDDSDYSNVIRPVLRPRMKLDLIQFIDKLRLRIASSVAGDIIESGILSC